MEEEEVASVRYALDRYRAWALGRRAEGVEDTIHVKGESSQTRTLFLNLPCTARPAYYTNQQPLETAIWSARGAKTFLYVTRAYAGLRHTRQGGPHALVCVWRG